jgi:hypothetical protein
VRALKAQVRGGRLVLDEPTNLPEGEEVEVYVPDAVDFSPEKRARLLKELDESQDEYERGEHDDAFEASAAHSARRPSS